MRTLLVLLSAVVLLLVSTVAARGATIDVRYLSEIDRDGRRYESVGAFWKTGVGETSSIELRIEEDRFLIRDARAEVEPGENCRPDADGWVECRTPRPDLRMLINVELWGADDALHATGGASDTFLTVAGMGGDDRLVVDAAVRASLGGAWGDDLIQGGPLNDDLSGGPGEDVLQGGDGDDSLAGNGAYPADDPFEHDVLDGGPGQHDLVSYVDRRDALMVDLGAGRGGVGGEDELVGIEGIYGGSGADRLIGTDEADTITGGGDEGDVIDGLGGDDTLSGHGAGTRIDGGEGADVITSFAGAGADAGPGDDMLRVFDRPAPVRCGEGNDTVVARGDPLGMPVSGLDCERFELPLFTVSAVRRTHKRLSFVARATYPLGARLCGMRAFLRDGVTGRERARVGVKVRDKRRRKVVLAARSGLPAVVVVELRPQRCDRRGRLRRADRHPSARLPLRLIANGS